MLNNPYLICSAIYYDDGVVRPHQPKNINQGIVVCGRRHYNCFVVLKEMFPNKNYKRNCIQGFLTSDNNFLNREQSLKIAKESGQVRNKLIAGCKLTSEDLY